MCACKTYFCVFFCFIVLQIFRKFFVQRITLEWQRQIGIEFILICFFFCFPALCRPSSLLVILSSVLFINFFPLKVWREAFQKHISIFILQLITAAGMITNAQLRGSAQYHVGCGWCRFDFAMTRRGYVVNVHQIINEINSIEKFLEWNLYFRAFSLVSFGPYAHRFCPIWLSSGSN